MILSACGWSRESRNCGIRQTSDLGSSPIPRYGFADDYPQAFPDRAMSLILASNSSIRKAMLDQAGLSYRIVSPDFDEDIVKQKHVGDGEGLVIRLAQGKALSIAAGDNDWIIGSDSSVIVDGERFSKPRNRDDAAAHLRAFSRRTLELSSGVALVRDGKVVWSHAETAKLHVRPLSEQFIADYLDAEWPAVSYCVGVFRIEGRGVTLFEKVEGSYFTILGMPLLPLLGALRERGLMPS